MRQQFNPENYDAWLQYYLEQVEQTGYGLAGFKGSQYQRGAGVGSFFRSLFRMAVPFIKSAASKVGKQTLATGANIAADVVKGRPVLESLEEHGREGASNLLKDVSARLHQKGNGLGIRPKGIKAMKSDIFQNKN